MNDEDFKAAMAEMDKMATDVCEFVKRHDNKETLEKMLEEIK